MNIIIYISLNTVLCHYKFCQPIKSSLMWPKNRFFDNANVLFSDFDKFKKC